MFSNRIKITYNNDFVKIVDRGDIKNFNSLIDWMDDFNNNRRLAYLTLTGRDLGSTIVLNSTNIRSIEFI
ncbi:MAG: hypothetical protein ACRDA3_06050 [Peptostreptococcaceae bacterium]